MRETFVPETFEVLETSKVWGKRRKTFEVSGTAKVWGQTSNSSYRVLLADTPTMLRRSQVLDWFGGRAAFDAVHQTLSDEKAIWMLIAEDEE